MDALNKKAATQPVIKDTKIVVIPIIGGIGEDVTAAGISRVLDASLVRSPEYAIFIFDTPGGHTDEVEPIIDQIKRCQAQGTRVVAYVHRAFSAGAVIAMACPEIFIQKGGSVGGAVPFQVGATGLKDVDAKFKSVWEAECRGAAIQGGHSELFALGMVDEDSELLLGRDGKIHMADGVVAGRVIKPKGKILTMTSQDAQDYGLAREGDERDMAVALGFQHVTNVCLNAAQLMTVAPMPPPPPPVHVVVLNGQAVDPWPAIEARYPGVPVRQLWTECQVEASQMAGPDANADSVDGLANYLFHQRAEAESQILQNGIVLPVAP
jgi:hypothetical protein